MKQGKKESWRKVAAAAAAGLAALGGPQTLFTRGAP
jgi:hypothetical protein